MVNATGCDGAEPKLAATGAGDLSYVLDDRRAPDAELVAACEASAPSAASSLRAPYVQAVSSDSARILFWAHEGATPEVKLSRPGGRVVEGRLPELEPSAGTPPGVVQFEARFSALSADTTYCYEVSGLGARAGFRTAPEGGKSAPTRFVALGDSGTGSWYQRAIAEALQTVPYAFVLHLGDLAYESGGRAELEQFFFGVYPTLTRSFAVFPVSGNHDYRTELAAPVREAFSLPDNAPAGRAERYYSFDWGDAHLVALDTEAIDVEQLAWLERDLAATARPWKIVFGHRPLYSSGESGSDARLAAALEPLFERYGVQLFLAGHEHDYERTRPLRGVTHVVSGGGGRGTRGVSRSWFTEYSEDVLHFLYIEIDGRSLTVHAIDGAGDEFDGARILLD